MTTGKRAAAQSDSSTGCVQAPGAGGDRMASGGDISYSDLKSLVGKDKGLVLVDVRNKDEVDKGRIPGSIHIPLSDVDKDLSLDPDAFQTKFGVAKPPLDAPNLVFHCQMGRRGQAATEKARSLGFKNARNYAGAYKEWSEKEKESK